MEGDWIADRRSGELRRERSTGHPKLRHADDEKVNADEDSNDRDVPEKRWLLKMSAKKSRRPAVRPLVQLRRHGISHSLRSPGRGSCRPGTRRFLCVPANEPLSSATTR